MEKKNKPLGKSRWDMERVELLEKLLGELKDLSEKDLVIVEGNRDLRSLRLIGVKSRIITGKELSTLQEILHEFRGQFNLILLPDFDEKGEENVRIWKKVLSQMDRVDESIWRRLRDLTRREVKDIEGLLTLARKLGFISEEIWSISKTSYEKSIDS